MVSAITRDTWSRQETKQAKHETTITVSRLLEHIYDTQDSHYLSQPMVEGHPPPLSSDYPENHHRFARLTKISILAYFVDGMLDIGGTILTFHHLFQQVNFQKRWQSHLHWRMGKSTLPHQCSDLTSGSGVLQLIGDFSFSSTWLPLGQSNQIQTMSKPFNSSKESGSRWVSQQRSSSELPWH